jgi:hypothetical protein
MRRLWKRSPVNSGKVEIQNDLAAANFRSWNFTITQSLFEAVAIVDGRYLQYRT